MKLDYTIESPQERIVLVEKILEESEGEASPSYLEALADYLIFAKEKEKEKKKEFPVLSENRMATIAKREPVSLDEIEAPPEEGNKYALFHPKVSITKEDLQQIPYLPQLKESIKYLESKQKTASGKDAYLIKKAIIELRKDQYLIKQSYQKPVYFSYITGRFPTPIEDKSYMASRSKEVIIKGISLMDPKVISAILCNYSKLKEDSYDQFSGDIWYLILSFEDICDRALENFPIYKEIVEQKIDQKQNKDIQQSLFTKFGETFTTEYISNLWRRKIPKLIASTALEDFIEVCFKKNNYPMKQCTKCGKLKPAHHQFFSRNRSSKDRFYSICKCCRSKIGRKRYADSKSMR